MCVCVVCVREKETVVMRQECGGSAALTHSWGQWAAAVVALGSCVFQTGKERWYILRCSAVLSMSIKLPPPSLLSFLSLSMSSLLPPPPPPHL